MFKIETVKIESLGEKLEVKPVPVSKMLEYRAQYTAMHDDDLPGLIGLMRSAIKDAVQVPEITDADLDQLDMTSIKTLFNDVATASGLISEKKEPENKTT